MQELVAVSVLKFDVNQAHTVVRSAAPSESAYCSANACCDPVPLLGATDTTAGDPPVTVQVPNICHPLLALAPPANMKMFFVPAYVEANVIGRFKVRFIPDDTTLAAA